MKVIDCEQNTPEWHAARLGRVTGSNMHRIITPTGDTSKQADDYMNRLIAEIITGERDEWDGNSHTERGKEFEQEAVDYYAMLNECEPYRIGFCHTDDGLVGCSPDRLIGDDGILEIKTAMGKEFVKLAKSDKLEQEHRPQTQTALFVLSERKWIDTMLYHPRMPKQIIIRSTRNASYQQTMTELLAQFRNKMQENIAILRAKGYFREAA